MTPGKKLSTQCDRWAKFLTTNTFKCFYNRTRPFPPDSIDKENLPEATPSFVTSSCKGEAKPKSSLTDRKGPCFSSNIPSAPNNDICINGVPSRARENFCSGGKDNATTSSLFAGTRRERFTTSPDFGSTVSTRRSSNVRIAVAIQYWRNGSAGDAPTNRSNTKGWMP